MAKWAVFHGFISRASLPASIVFLLLAIEKAEGLFHLLRCRVSSLFHQLGRFTRNHCPRSRVHTNTLPVTSSRCTMVSTSSSYACSYSRSNTLYNRLSIGAFPPFLQNHRGANLLFLRITVIYLSTSVYRDKNCPGMP